MQITVRKILPNELAWANTQYASIHFSPSTRSDFIVVAEVNGIKAGMGRLTRVADDMGELGGIFVFPEFRGHHVATHIVEFLIKSNTYPTLFCIPFAHLEAFYGSFGFLPVDPLTPEPASIRKKMNWCSTAYESPVVLLCKRSGNAPLGTATHI